MGEEEELGVAEETDVEAGGRGVSFRMGELELCEDFVRVACMGVMKPGCCCGWDGGVRGCGGEGAGDALTKS